MILVWIWLIGYAVVCSVCYFLLWLISPSEFEAQWGEIAEVGPLAVWLSTSVAWAVLWPVGVVWLVVAVSKWRSRRRSAVENPAP